MNAALPGGGTTADTTIGIAHGRHTEAAPVPVLLTVDEAADLLRTTRRAVQGLSITMAISKIVLSFARILIARIEVEHGHVQPFRDAQRVSMDMPRQSCPDGSNRRESLSRVSRFTPVSSHSKCDVLRCYSFGMDARQLLAEALRLSDEERAALAGELIQSLDREIDEGAEAAWSAEIRARLDRVDAGSARTVSWAEARRRIHAAAGRGPRS